MRIKAFALLILLSVLWQVAPARAQTLESVVMPGQVIKGHTEIEHDCSKCHVRFKPSAQPRLCRDCHREVDTDVRKGAGYHGRIRQDQCRQCHTDHKGREAKIVLLDEREFDHRLTDYPLRGAHQRKDCAGCHRVGKKFSQAPTDCYACHRGNDKHKGGLGDRCENCHNEEQWKDARFDHARTRFPLLHRHAQARCADCHLQERYTGTPRDCASCHRKDDAHKGHNGPRCEACHTEQDWKTTTFRHDRDANYPLLGRHRNVACVTCHRAPLYREKLPTQCHACHRQDDAHKGVLGDKCANCHTPDGWKGGRFDHDLNTRFRLLGDHRALKCETCHKTSGLREKPDLTCVSCHQRDDHEKGHKGRYGARCETCHVERGFRAIIFDHYRDTKFGLDGKHRKVRCDTCHRDGPYRAKADSACHACHKHEDIHFGSFERECERCHRPDDWRKIMHEAINKYCRDPGKKALERPSSRAPADFGFWIPDCAAPLGKGRRP